MIARFYGRAYSIQNLREKAFITREGVSMLGISEAAEAIGFRTQGVRITVEELEKGGVQAVLGQYQGGRAGYRDGALAGTGAGVLRDGGRGERQET